MEVLSSGSGVKQVSAGVGHTQLVKTDGSVWAAGLNNYGQLGDGTKTQSNKFVKIVDGGVKEVRAGQYFSVLLNDKHELCVTGDNYHGMLGTGDRTNVVGFDKKCSPRPGTTTTTQPGFFMLHMLMMDIFSNITNNRQEWHALLSQCAIRAKYDYH